ncbi:MAG: ATP-binding protein, partial [Candidatus Limnocylindrales bacterium]
MDALTVALQVIYYGVFAASLWRYRQRPGPVERAVVLVFAPLAALFAYSLLNTVAPTVGATLRPAVVAVLLLQPVLVLRLASMVRRLPAWVMPAVWIGFAINTFTVGFLPRNPTFTLAYVGFFFVVQTAAGLRFLHDGRRRYGLARLRLTLAGLATVCFGVGILIAGLGAAASPTGTSTSATAISRGFAVVAGLGYLTAFLQPRWFRRLAQQSVAFDVTQRLVLAPSHSGPELLWSELARAAREILGARSIEIRVDGRTGPLATLGDADISALVPRRLDDPSTPVTRISVPIAAESGWSGMIIGEVEGRPLFVEDDLGLLAVLGGLTARTVERLDAFIRLEEAQRSLAETAAVRESEARFRALLDADPNAILALDAANRVTWATRQAADLFGFSVDELVGLDLTDLVPSTEGALAPLVADAHGVRRAETTARRKDGTLFPAELAQTRFELDDVPFNVAVISDVSWRLEADRIRERFVGVLSHELRTPVTSIYGGAQLLLSRRGRMDEETRGELLHTIADESERLQRIIENLVVLARIERGTELGGPRPVLIDRLLGDLIERERILWPGGTIELDVKGPLPVVAADDDHLAQIMRNLLSNAAKYAGDGARVDVTVRLEGEKVVVRVLDDGAGIAPEAVERVFTLYYRSPEHANVAGAGMGLFVVHQLVAAMGGEIWAKARPEGGTEFGFTLPMYVDEVAEAEDRASDIDLAGERDVVRKRRGRATADAGPGAPG